MPVIPRKSITTRNLVLVALFAGLAVVLSGINFPVGPTKVFPCQHALNAVAGVLLGPWYAALAALIAAVMRNLLGTGTIFAFPGSIPGALVVGFAYRWWKKDYAAFLEPLGTGPLGATISALIVAPLIGKTMTWVWFQTAFLASSIPGSILGFIVLWGLRRVGVKRLLEELARGSR
jgi:energy coupling factor transporter S component ThiW